MNVLKGILSDSEAHYRAAKEKIQRELARLAQGSIKKRNIAGQKYYYLQKRSGKKIVHKYIGKDVPEDLLRQIRRRRALKGELRKVNEALKILKRARGKKRD